MVPKTVLPNSEYMLDKKATGEFFLQNPDALHELNRVMAIQCAEIAIVRFHLQKRQSSIAVPFRPLLGEQGSSLILLTSDRYPAESGNSQAVQARLPNRSKHL
jgi:hypothetical protein